MADTKIQLLSRAVPANPTGNYSFHEKSLLIPHETLRREMIYGQKALEHYDPTSHPWKALCFHTWLMEFLFPAIHGHHELEENVFFDYYKKLGVTFPDKQTDDHKTLMASLRQITDVSRRILDLVSLGGNNTDQVKTAVEELRSIFNTFVTHMDAHLNEEEAFWPAVVEKHGEKTFKKLEDKIVSYGRKHEGKAFENLAAAVLYAAGIEISNIEHYPEDTYWGGPEARAELFAAFPYPVRAFLLPGWNKRYQRYKTMIHSVVGDRDILHLQDQQGGCTAGSCIIA
mmetsp:Transcript_15202/g.16487  ORF Transcript_15202/g.16487 Transcript_15202/m.16487 type:complete len:285 (+) Transcript_15202:100-954(+)|eukprot:CAMPEP_0173140430 /NCGR_PEP_ID=MMETSP1105-20130129/4885_1 /TAXON_ID=2985 /ORGANISM="Ochromonas sp., Strain BG-1" /LENGTH=284 /DNA_ID=CAMNT_0014053423 /DNA_START=29 /DNA_END=883 /DNA_ORIENTATION=+